MAAWGISEGKHGYSILKSSEGKSNNACYTRKITVGERQESYLHLLKHIS